MQCDSAVGWERQGSRDGWRSALLVAAVLRASGTTVEEMEFDGAPSEAYRLKTRLQK